MDPKQYSQYLPLVYSYNLFLTSNGILYLYTDIVLLLYLCAKSQNETAQSCVFFFKVFHSANC